MTNALPSVDFLRECFELSEHSPSGLVWKERPLRHFKTSRGWRVSNTKHAGKSAGTRSEDVDFRYWFVKVSQNRFAAHCIVYALVNNDADLSGYEIDHIDRDRENNSPVNLRKVTASQNQMNRRKQKNNKSGSVGVSFVRRSNKWRADIHKQGKQFFLGFFQTKEQAIAARKEATLTLHGQHAATNLTYA